MCRKRSEKITRPDFLCPQESFPDLGQLAGATHKAVSGNAGHLLISRQGESGMQLGCKMNDVFWNERGQGDVVASAGTCSGVGGGWGGI